jgi:DNA-binding MarR family transcriptional regulator
VSGDRRTRFRQAFWRAFREADSIRLRQWERSGVTLPQLRVLYFLRRQPGATTGELARRLGITVSTTSGLVIKLVDRGLVARGSLADDRRQAPLRLSEAGAALLGELSDEPHAFLDGVADRLGEHLDAVIRALDQLAEAGAHEGAILAGDGGPVASGGDRTAIGGAAAPGERPSQAASGPVPAGPEAASGGRTA